MMEKRQQDILTRSNLGASEKKRNEIVESQRKL